MEDLRTVRDVALVTSAYIKKQVGVDRCKFVKNQIAWVVENDGWFSPRQVFLSKYSQDIYRFSSHRNRPLPKNLWVLDPIDPLKFEITIHASEVDQKFVNDLMDFVDWCTLGGSDEYHWPLFKEQGGFPGYAWSDKAHAVYKPIAGF